MKIIRVSEIYSYIYVNNDPPPSFSYKNDLVLFQLYNKRQRSKIYLILCTVLLLVGPLNDTQDQTKTLEDCKGLTGDAVVTFIFLCLYFDIAQSLFCIFSTLYLLFLAFNVFFFTSIFKFLDLYVAFCNNCIGCLL